MIKVYTYSKESSKKKQHVRARGYSIWTLSQSILDL